MDLILLRQQRLLNISLKNAGLIQIDYIGHLMNNAAKLSGTLSAFQPVGDLQCNPVRASSADQFLSSLKPTAGHLYLGGSTRDDDHRKFNGQSNLISSSFLNRCQLAKIHQSESVAKKVRLSSMKSSHSSLQN